MGADERSRRGVLAPAVRGRSARALSERDTIFALSSGAVPAAIAVVRVSGPGAGGALATLVGRVPPARRAVQRTLRAADGSALDRCLVLWLPGPDSATGEDVAELHLHGSRATVAAVAATLRGQGLRGARGGEFTRRALEHGRIDLAQAEGLADLLAAETEEERRVALATSEGQLSRALHGWYERLLALSAGVEAQLDHADEDDVSGTETIVEDCVGLATEIEEVLARPTVERLRHGPTIALAGPPNAGKSSLFNALTERDAAIVTAIAGTTRDVLEASVAHQGRSYRVLDTAGLTESGDTVERIGIERARSVAQAADVVLWLGDEPPDDERALWINARCDLPGRELRPGTKLSVSALRPATVVALWQQIERASAHILSRGGEFLFSERQRENMVRVEDALRSAVTTGDELIRAEWLRYALCLMDDVLGKHAPEQMLNALFARFCIGK